MHGQVDPDRLTALEVVLLAQQGGGLRDPVGVRRHRQLGALARGVVVERHQGTAGVGAQQPGEDRGKGGSAHLGGIGVGCSHAAIERPIEGLWAVVPAGGAGTRLWPLSRRRPEVPARPDRDGRSLLQHTVDRLAPLVEDRLLVVTGADHREAVLAELPGVDPEAVVTEPSPRDSMAAIGLAAAMLERATPWP